ncbi:MAG: porin [Cytophagaceae bacterium]|jgi:hypothetical protein|nr:porin [Cytophagaceae bacterium]
MRKLLLFPFMVGLAWNAVAQDSTAAKPDGALTVSGYVDAYYNYAFNKPKSGSLLGGGGSGRAFDRTTDQFSLGLVQLKTMYSSSKVDIVADLTFGPNAELGNFGNLPAVSANPAFTSLYGTSAAIKQAYGTYKATDKLSFTVGQFGTHIGYEVIDAPVNFHYSLSNLFNNGPFYHVGAKVNYAISDKLAVMGGVVNNWDNLLDNNEQKSVIGQVYIKPTDGFNVYLNYIGGDNDELAPYKITSAKRYGEYNRHLYDLTTGYQLTDKFYVGLNAAYGYYVGKNSVVEDQIKALTANAAKFKDSSRTRLDWGGVAIYTTYKVSDVFTIGARYEYFEDYFGVRYLGGTMPAAAGAANPKVNNNSLTITGAFTLANGNFILKPEFRFDGSSVALYEDKNGGAIKEQKTIGLATIFKF